MASYGSIANHLDTLAQRHEIARLEGVNRSLRAAAEAAAANEELRLVAGRVPALTAELAAAEAARERALSLADAAAGEAEDLRRELALAEDRIAELAGPDGAAAALAIKAEAVDPLAAADAQLRTAAARIADISRERDRLVQLTEAQADEMATLRGQLKAAEAEITRLETLAAANQATEAALDASSR
jgi:chromosome segregation ATPase